jgi:ferric-dicitrate binding protein FerR (iron transport regulator)
MKNLVVFSLFLSVVLSACSGKKISTQDNFELVSLPDGSKAYVNENSEISYDENFEDRTIQQEGEVFYKVIKGNTPFTVKTDGGEVKVTGTEFNVKSTGEDLEVEVEKGSVEVSNGKITENIIRGEKAIVKGIDKGIKLAKAEYKHKKWIKKLIKEVMKASKEIEKDSRKIGNEINQEINNMK